MEVQYIHPFPVSEQEMSEIQLQLKNRVEIIPYSGIPTYVCGVDLAYFADQAIAVLVVMNFATKEIMETVHYQDSVTYEYRPGFLAFRELPIFLKAWEKLKTEPDLVFFDGNGLLHPQRVGIATHASFFIQKPTIGVAKNHLLGTYHPPDLMQGSFSYIYDQEEVIGAVLRTQTKVKPVYVSIGNWIDLKSCIDFTMHFVGPNSRIPEITRQADLLTRQLRRNSQSAP
jgi:deoxyribonuclease V